MLHPIFSTVIQRPDLIAEHISAYVAVLGQDVQAVRVQLVQRIIAGSVAVVFGLLFMVFTGIAVMLGVTQNNFNWSLIVVPGIMLVVAVIAAVKAIKPFSQGNFSEFKSQLKNDVSALHAAS